MDRNISIRDNACKYLGVWQENEAGEVVSYGTVSWFEIGFTGSRILLNLRKVGDVEFFADGEAITPKTLGDDALEIEVGLGKHILKIKTVPDARVFLKSIQIPEGETVFRTPDRKYIQFIGDSITYKYPGYSSTAGEMLGVDYSVVAYGGMSLKDGWGWYPLREGVSFRPGMESMYFKLERPHEAVTFTDYKLDFLRIPDVLVIALGTNDYLNSQEQRDKGHIEAFVTAYLGFAERLRGIYPNAKIYMLKTFTESYCRNEAITAAYKAILSKLGNVELIDSLSWKVEISDDHTHPTDRGYAEIAQNLTDYLRPREA